MSRFVNALIMLLLGISVIGIAASDFGVHLFRGRSQARSILSRPIKRPSIGNRALHTPGGDGNNDLPIDLLVNPAVYGLWGSQRYRSFG